MLGEHSRQQGQMTSCIHISISSPKIEVGRDRIYSTLEHSPPLALCCKFLLGFPRKEQPVNKIRHKLIKLFKIHALFEFVKVLYYLAFNTIYWYELCVICNSRSQTVKLRRTVIKRLCSTKSSISFDELPCWEARVFRQLHWTTRVINYLETQTALFAGLRRATGNSPFNNGMFWK